MHALTPNIPSQVRAQALPDLLDVLLAERKVADALNVLEEGEKLAAGGQVEGGSGRGVLSSKDAAELHATLTERRARLAEQLAEAAQQPSVRGAELRDAVAALVRLGDGPRAHTLLLSAHQERLKMTVRALRPTGTSYGGAYTAALSQVSGGVAGGAVAEQVVPWHGMLVIDLVSPQPVHIFSFRIHEMFEGIKPGNLVHHLRYCRAPGNLPKGLF
jgi:hypothetical protein